VVSEVESIGVGAKVTSGVDDGKTVASKVGVATGVSEGEGTTLASGVAVAVSIGVIVGSGDAVSTGVAVGLLSCAKTTRGVPKELTRSAKLANTENNFRIITISTL